MTPSPTRSPVRVGLIGCGNISSIYLKNARAAAHYQIVACADLQVERAEARAAEFGVPRACSVEALLGDPEIEVVLNLTIPQAHAQVALAALAAGKSVYSEKPLAVTRTEGELVLEMARARRLRVGAAPDTFLGAGIQTCRGLIDAGAIGIPVAATAFMMGRGHESWHPDPAFYYKAGGGPMFDMGPYYLTALIALLGPIRRVTGSTRISFPERTITSQPRHGEKINVEVPTHVAGLMEFGSGAIGTMITSFDICGHQLPRIEIYGSEGSLSVPDPNSFGGPVTLLRGGTREWVPVELSHANSANSRGIGLAEMCLAMRTGRPHRASGDLALHVLDAMQAFHEASETGSHITLSSRCERPAALPAGLGDWELDD